MKNITYKHSSECSWNTDWHTCNCGAFDNRKDIINRYKVEEEIRIEKGCRCGSCWERTGRWLVVDNESDAEDLVFNSEEEAEAFVTAVEEVP